MRTLRIQQRLHAAHSVRVTCRSIEPEGLMDLLHTCRKCCVRRCVAVCGISMPRLYASKNGHRRSQLASAVIRGFCTLERYEKSVPDAVQACADRFASTCGHCNSLRLRELTQRSPRCNDDMDAEKGCRQHGVWSTCLGVAYLSQTQTTFSVAENPVPRLNSRST